MHKALKVDRSGDVFQVMMKDIVTPVSHEEVRSMIRKSLENAALLNYTRLCGETKVEGNLHDSEDSLANEGSYTYVSFN